MKFKNFLLEIAVENFKVGDIIRVKEDIEGYENRTQTIDILKTKGKIGTVKTVLGYGNAWLGIEFREKIHDYDNTGAEIPTEKPIGYTWWVGNNNKEVEKVSSSKYVKQLNFESLSEDTEKEYLHIITVNTVKERKKVEDIWAKRTGLRRWTENMMNSPVYTPDYIHLVNPKYNLEHLELTMRHGERPETQYSKDGDKVLTYNEFMNKYGTTSKYVKQLKFEAVEPGQFIEKDIYVVRIKNVWESRKVQEWAFKHRFVWHGGRVYNSEVMNYGTNSSIAIIMENNRLNYTRFDWYKTIDAKTYYRSNVFGFYEDIGSFLDDIKNDSRIEKEK